MGEPEFGGSSSALERIRISSTVTGVGPGERVANRRVGLCAVHGDPGAGRKVIVYRARSEDG